MMTWPQPFWAVLLAFQGTALAIAVLWHPTPENIGLAVLAVASNLVSGALGAFAGHAAALNSTTTTATGPNPVINNPPPSAPVVVKDPNS